MGYTDFSKRLVEQVLQDHPAKNVIDLGAQNDFSGPTLPAPYISEWYKSKGLYYACIDLNGENSSVVLDLGVVQHAGPEVDMVCDFGTSEHIGREGKFDWEAIYSCWVNKWNLLKIGGIMVNENPMTGHWKNHGFQWYCKNFYHQLEQGCDFKIIDIGEVCATGNCETGKNIYSVLQKTGLRFVSIDEFKLFDLKLE